MPAPTIGIRPGGWKAASLGKRKRNNPWWLEGRLSGQEKYQTTPGGWKAASLGKRKRNNPRCLEDYIPEQEKQPNNFWWLEAKETPHKATAPPLGKGHGSNLPHKHVGEQLTDGRTTRQPRRQQRQLNISA